MHVAAVLAVPPTSAYVSQRYTYSSGASRERSLNLLSPGKESPTGMSTATGDATRCLGPKSQHGGFRVEVRWGTLLPPEWGAAMGGGVSPWLLPMVQHGAGSVAWGWCWCSGCCWVHGTQRGAWGQPSSPWRGWEGQGSAEPSHSHPNLMLVIPHCEQEGGQRVSQGPLQQSSSACVIPHVSATGTAEGAGGCLPSCKTTSCSMGSLFLQQKSEGMMRVSWELTETCLQFSFLSPGRYSAGKQWGGCKIPSAGIQPWSLLPVQPSTGTCIQRGFGRAPCCGLHTI